MQRRLDQCRAGQRSGPRLAASQRRRQLHLYASHRLHWQRQLHLSGQRRAVPQQSPTVVTITVTPPGNTAPTAVNDNYFGTEDTLIPQGVSVTANDTDPDLDNLTAVLVGNVAHGTLSLNANGTFSYTPAPDFSGIDSFTYQANDGKTNSLNTATVFLSIAPVNDAPVAVGDSGTVLGKPNVDGRRPRRPGQRHRRG